MTGREVIDRAAWILAALLIGLAVGVPLLVILWHEWWVTVHCTTELGTRVCR